MRTFHKGYSLFLFEDAGVKAITTPINRTRNAVLRKRLDLPPDFALGALCGGGSQGLERLVH